jgi:hypothetical protein
MYLLSSCKNVDQREAGSLTSEAAEIVGVNGHPEMLGITRLILCRHLGFVGRMGGGGGVGVSG